MKLLRPGPAQPIDQERKQARINIEYLLSKGYMNSEAAEILATALEQEASNHEKGVYSSIGDRWDDIYAELLPIEEDIDNPLYGLAFRFWDDWCDSSNHNWQYHEPITKDMWPGLAREIASSLREKKLPDNEVIISQFFPRPKAKWIRRLKHWFAKNTKLSG